VCIEALIKFNDLMGRMPLTFVLVDFDSKYSSTMY
jgi:hypothetical protein